MDKLEASLRTIDVCTSLIKKSTYAAGVVFDSREMLKEGILNTMDQLLEIVKEIETDEDSSSSHVCEKINQLEEKKNDLYKQLGIAHNEILDLKNRVYVLEKICNDVNVTWVEYKQIEEV